MNSWQPRRRECLLALFLSMGCLSAQAGSAEELVWIGGAGSSWNTPENWAPLAIPGEDPIQRIPEDGDSVLIADTTHGSLVRLDGDSPRLAGLEVANGFEVGSNGYFLNVENDEGTATTIIRGAGTRASLLARNVANLRSFQTDLLEIVDGGTLRLVDDRSLGGDDDGTAHVLHGATIDAVSLLTGYGRAVFGNETTPADTILLTNEGTIRPVRAPSTELPGYIGVATRGGAILDLDGENNSGVIDADGSGRVVFSGPAAPMIPFGGHLLIGAGDAAGIELMEDVRIEFNGSDDAAARLFDPKRISGSSTIDVNSGVAVIWAPIPDDFNQPGEGPEFEFIGDSVRVHEGATLALASDDGWRHRLTGSSFHLDDGSTLRLSSWENVTLSFEELDLDGDSGDTYVDLFGSLTINAEAIDTDPDSPGFDGHFSVSGGSAVAQLTVNIPGGWTLNGRLSAGEAGHVYGTPITVDSRGPDDGLIAAGGDFPYATIHSDLIFSENAQVDVDFGRLYLEGNVTSYRSVLGSGEFYGLSFRGDVTTFAVPTMLNVAASFEGSTVVLDADLMIPSGIGVFFDEDVRILGDGRVLYEERGDFVRGDFNGNGLVEQADLDLVLSHWGEIAATTPERWVIDPPSGTIDQDELDRVLSGWGGLAVLPQETASAAPVPEPVSGILVLLALGAALIGKGAGDGIGSPEGTAFL